MTYTVAFALWESNPAARKYTTNLRSRLRTNVSAYNLDGAIRLLLIVTPLPCTWPRVYTHINPCNITYTNEIIKIQCQTL